MSTFQVTKYHPVQVGADVGRPLTVKNINGPTVSYGTTPVGTGTSLTNGSSVTIETTTWFSTTSAETSELEYSLASSKTPDEPVLGSEVVEASNIKALAVTEAKLAALAVSEAKIAALAVSEGKIAAEAVTTAKLATGAVTEAKLGALSVVGSKIVVPTIKLPSGEVEGEFGIPAFVPSLRACWVTYVSEASATTKEIPHQLNTEQFAVAAAYNFKKTGKATGAGVTSVGIKEWTSVSTTKVTIVLNAAPAAKDVLAFLFVG